MMELLLKFLHRIGEMQKNFIWKKFHLKEKKVSKCIKKRFFFEKTISAEEIFPKKKWFKKFSNYWFQVKKMQNRIKKFY